MATRPPTQSSYRPSNGNGLGGAGSSVDLGNAAISRMAREDTRWFIAAVVVLSLVLFLALPLSMLLVVDHMRLQSQIKAEIRAEKRELQKLKEEIKKARTNEKSVDD